MELEEFSNNINKKMNLINITVNENEINNFYNYMRMLLDWNEKINLTAITDEKEIILKHFIDSVTINKYIKKNCKLIDIGTGAGFPGVPLKILNDDLSVVLLDSLNKRINFLKEVIAFLKLEKITPIHDRAEELGSKKEYREQFDIATSRAVAPLNYLLEYMLPFVKVGGYCICMKGGNIETEINESKEALRKLGGKIEKIDYINLPESEIERNIIIIKKIKNTPEKYPRKAGIPKKSPL